jgi:ribose transport system permease protein
VGRSILGVFLLTVINNGLVLSGVSPNIQQAIAGVIIVVAVVVTDLRRRASLRVVK